jgi:anti-sigma-K factor RskA
MSIGYRVLQVCTAAVVASATFQFFRFSYILTERPQIRAVAQLQRQEASDKVIA